MEFQQKAKGEKGMNETIQNMANLLPYMVEPTITAIKLFFLTLLIGLPLGMVLALGRMSKLAIIRYPIQIYNLIMRGTPLILQLYLIYYQIPKWIQMYHPDFRFDRFTAVVIGFSINYAAYFCEIYRGGIQTIPKGQYEAAKMLGFTKGQTFFKIVLPQVVKQVIPPLGSEFMVLVKDTSLAHVIGVAELYLFSTNQMATRGSMMPVVMAGIFYLIMNWIVEKCFILLEKRLSYYQ